MDLWLNEVLNAMVEMEKIPDVLKCGVEILIYIRVMEKIP